MNEEGDAGDWKIDGDWGRLMEIRLITEIKCAI
jgi:hypothetical protein